MTANEWRDIESAPKDGTEVPANSWDAFAYLISRCASGLYGELVEEGRTDAQARNSIIRAFLDMAAGEACRVARREGRVPDPEKWREAVTNAFDRAVKRTASTSCPPPPVPSGEGMGVPVHDVASPSDSDVARKDLGSSGSAS